MIIDVECKRCNCVVWIRYSDKDKSNDTLCEKYLLTKNNENMWGMDDCNVIRVIGEPVCENGMWGIKVEYNCNGKIDTVTIFLDSKSEVLKIKSGYKFKH